MAIRFALLADDMSRVLEVTREDLPTVKTLFLEYAKSLNLDFSRISMDRDLTELPGEYSAPDGCILIEWEDSIAVGCVALRKLERGTCEMKRLYVRPAFRGKGTGALLARTIIQEARKRGYNLMKLDTVPSMTQALDLYTHLGFKRIPRYQQSVNPVAGAIFMQLELQSS